MGSSLSVYAVVLAGGGGTRLWPLSRMQQPKHLLHLCSEHSMLWQTFARVRPLVPRQNLMAITVAEHAGAVLREVPDIPEENVVAEPAGRSTGPCVGLMALLIRKRDPGAVMVSLAADHAIGDEEGFRSVLWAALRAAEEGHLVTLGIVPDRPETGYGYIERGGLLEQVAGHNVYRVVRFAEKPDHDTAESFLRTGRYLWNASIFVWKVSAILAEIERLLPELHAQLVEIEPALGTPQQAEVIERVWRDVRPVSIDVGVMEKANDVVVVPADIGWSDVGCWTSVADLAVTDADGNVTEGETVFLDCKDTYILSSGRLIAALGLQGIVIIETGDAVLVCPKERAQDVRKIVERLRLEDKDKYL